MDQVIELLTKYKLEDTKNIFQILFFIATGTAAVLSYLAAKKSVFSNQKNEVFKEQIKECLEIYSIFHVNDEREFFSDFDFRRIQMINVKIMMHCKLQFLAKGNDELIDDIEKCIRSCVESMNHEVSRRTHENLFNKISDEYKPLNWKERLYVGSQQKNILKKINFFVNSALIPKELIDKLKSFIDVVESINDDISVCIQRESVKIEQGYSDYNELLRKMESGLEIMIVDRMADTNEYIRRMSVAASQITAQVRKYLNVDELTQI